MSNFLCFLGIFLQFLYIRAEHGQTNKNVKMKPQINWVGFLLGKMFLSNLEIKKTSLYWYPGMTTNLLGNKMHDIPPLPAAAFCREGILEGPDRVIFFSKTELEMMDLYFMWCKIYLNNTFSHELAAS